jgi:hypothetical protein
MVVNFEVGKTYRYKGEIGNTSPFTDIGIDKRDARLMASGKPLVCTYAEKGYWRPKVGFRGMRHENSGWAFTCLYDLFEEVKETTVVKEKQKEEKKEMTKFEVGKKYRYTGLLSSFFGFTGIGIATEDAEYIASGKPLTVEWFELPHRIKFKEFKNPWAFTYAMLDKFEEVADDAPVYGERVEPSKASYIARQTEWVTRNNVKVGTKVRLTRTAEDHEGGWNNAWASGMDKNVGKIGTVAWGIETSYGLFVDFGEGEDGAEYGYPFFVLEVVEETPAPTAEVDWEKKYTELEKQYQELKNIAVEYMRQLSKQGDSYKTILEVLWTL